MDKGGAPAAKQSKENNSIIPTRIAGRVTERYCPVPSKRPKSVKILLLFCLPELLPVCCLESFPSVRAMCDPEAERGRRREVFHPFVDPGLRLPEASRPEPIN
jgi:hypothetical protein